MSEEILGEESRAIDTEMVDHNQAVIEGVEDSETPDAIGLSESGAGEIVQVSTGMMHSGPLPHPNILRGYEDILPGSAERILQMAEKEQIHRFDLDFKFHKTDSRDSLLGIACATVLGVLTLTSGVCIVKIAPSTSGIVIGGLLGASGLAAIVGTFIRGTKTSWKMNSDNNKDEPK